VYLRIRLFSEKGFEVVSFTLRKLRLRNNETQIEMAARLGINNRDICVFETGQRLISERFVQLLKDNYQVTEDELLDIISWNSTDFGSESTVLSGLGSFTLRKLRLRYKETQAEMATRLGVSNKYISLFEKGKRSMNNKFITKLTKEYYLSTREVIELISWHNPFVTLDMRDYSSEDAKIIKLFCSLITSLSDEDKESILKILYKGDVDSV
jgi:transcriptional regulator with XRE-family HTH domain